MNNNICRVCLSCDKTVMNNLADIINDQSVAELLSFVSGITVRKKVLLAAN